MLIFSVKESDAHLVNFNCIAQKVFFEQFFHLMAADYEDQGRVVFEKTVKFVSKITPRSMVLQFPFEEDFCLFYLINKKIIPYEQKPYE